MQTNNYYHSFIIVKYSICPTLQLLSQITVSLITYPIPYGSSHNNPIIYSGSDS